MCMKSDAVCVDDAEDDLRAWLAAEIDVFCATAESVALVVQARALKGWAVHLVFDLCVRRTSSSAWARSHIGSKMRHENLAHMTGIIITCIAPNNISYSRPSNLILNMASPLQFFMNPFFISHVLWSSKLSRFYLSIWILYSQYLPRPAVTFSQYVCLANVCKHVR